MNQRLLIYGRGLARWPIGRALKTLVAMILCWGAVANAQTAVSPSAASLNAQTTTAPILQDPWKIYAVTNPPIPDRTVPPGILQMIASLRKFLKENPGYRLGRIQSHAALPINIRGLYLTIIQGADVCNDQKLNSTFVDRDVVETITGPYSIISRKQLETLIGDFGANSNYIAGHYAGPMSRYHTGDHWGVIAANTPGYPSGRGEHGTACIFGWMKPGQQTKVAFGDGPWPGPPPDQCFKDSDCRPPFVCVGKYGIIDPKTGECPWRCSCPGSFKLARPGYVRFHRLTKLYE